MNILKCKFYFVFKNSDIFINSVKISISDGYKFSATRFEKSLSLLKTETGYKTRALLFINLWIFHAACNDLWPLSLGVPSQPSAESMASLWLSQQRCVKASIASQWQLAEAQDQLCGLELHSSESVEQERAQALASSAELLQTEQEWRHKETMLGRSPTLCPEASRDVFDKVSHISPLEKSFSVHLVLVRALSETDHCD